MEGVAVILAVAAIGIAVAALAMVLRAERRPADLSPGGARLMELERRLAQLGHRLEVVESDVDAQRGDGEGRALEATPRGTSVISRIGVVRFDAFEDTGGAQSFVLALIDDDGDGVVLTSLHSRPTTRVYLKTIRRGIADSPLSGEEERALRRAGITPERV